MSDVPQWLYDSKVDELRSVAAERDAFREALRDNDRDARWIVGQWQRLRDEPVTDVALAIMDRCSAALAPASPASAGTPPSRSERKQT
jgi:hypothetical protein